MHSDIARVLVGASAAGTDIRPEFIAQHFTEAGLLPEAIDWWASAGEQAGQRSANAEAVAHYRKAIDLLAGLPESGARTVQEVKLQVALGYAYIRQTGWAADPVAKCLARAEELCNELGNAPQLVPALAGMTVFYVVKGDQRMARAIAHQTLALARNSGDTGYLLEAHNVMAAALFYSGRLLEVLEHCDVSARAVRSRGAWGHAFVYGQDPKVCALSWRAFSLIGLGCLDQALATAELRARIRGRRLNHGAVDDVGVEREHRGPRGTRRPDDGRTRSIGDRLRSRTRHLRSGSPCSPGICGLFHPKSGEARRRSGADPAGAGGAQATGSGNSVAVMFATSPKDASVSAIWRSVGGDPGGPRTRERQR